MAIQIRAYKGEPLSHLKVSLTLRNANLPLHSAIAGHPGCELQIAGDMARAVRNSSFRITGSFNDTT